jgi:hypothetical protein
MSDGWRDGATLRVEGWNFILRMEPKLPGVRSIAWLGLGLDYKINLE